jgi:hypothetical protein
VSLVELGICSSPVAPSDSLSVNPTNYITSCFVFTGGHTLLFVYPPASITVHFVYVGNSSPSAVLRQRYEDLPSVTTRSLELLLPHTEDRSLLLTKQNLSGQLHCPGQARDWSSHNSR